MSKRGRPRKTTAKRYPNGQTVHASIKPELVIAQRQTLVGKDQATNPIAGQPIGILRLNKLVTEAQFLAAEKLERDWRAWDQLWGAAPHHARCGERDGAGTSAGPSEERGRQIQASFESVRAVVDACEQPKLIWAIFDTLLMEHVLPHSWGDSGRLMFPNIVSVALNRGLDALCRHYRIKDQEAA